MLQMRHPHHPADLVHHRCLARRLLHVRSDLRRRHRHHHSRHHRDAALAPTARLVVTPCGRPRRLWRLASRQRGRGCGMRTPSGRIS